MRSGALYPRRKKRFTTKTKRTRRKPLCTLCVFVVQSSSGHQHLRPFKIEPEPHFLQPRIRHRPPQRFSVFGVEQQEPAAARADELAADCAVAPSELVPLVDLRIAHAARAPLLVLPMFVHQLAEFAAPSRFQRGLTAIP